MKAAVHTRYGPPEVVRIRDVDRPAVGDRDVLVRVHSECLTGEALGSLKRHWGTCHVIKAMDNTMSNASPTKIQRHPTSGSNH